MHWPKFTSNLDRASSFIALAVLTFVAPFANATGPRDFDGDGESDLIWSNGVTGEKLMWLMNGGTIIGGGTLLIDPDDPVWSIIAVGDFNGDGKMDLLWRNSVSYEIVTWLVDGTEIIGAASLWSGTQVKPAGGLLGGRLHRRWERRSPDYRR